jgi:hypothetical protein
MPAHTNMTQAVGLLIATSLLTLHTQAAPFEEIVKSKPALIDGFEFVAATESTWKVPQQFGKTQVDIQLYITNRVGRDRVFPTFDTYILHIKDTSGHEMLGGGGRDGTLLSRPLMIRAGETCCFHRFQGEIAWNKADNWKTRVFTFNDSTGAWFNWFKLQPGSYLLSFSVACDGLDSETQFFSKMQNFDWKPYLVWTGHGATHDVAFTVVDTPNP